jgi:glycosyltransferase involved in cell wall biosynthesis
VRLTLLGDTQDAAYLKQLTDAVARSGCADRITFESPVPEAELPALFDAYDIYIFPSLYEPFSLTLIHALALGIPTVASRAGGNPEIVRDGQTGLLFDKGDPASLAAAVRRLAADGTLRARLAQAGRQAAGGFTFERMVGQMAAFLAARP